MTPHAAQEIPSALRRQSFPFVLAFYMSWLGTMAWTACETPGTFTTETDITLSGITLFFGAAFLLIFDADLTRVLRQLLPGIHHLPRTPRLACFALLRTGWLAPRARLVRRSLEITVLTLVSVVPGLWLLSSLI